MFDNEHKRSLFNQWSNIVLDAMNRVDYSDPVGFIVDITDTFGRNLTERWMREYHGMGPDLLQKTLDDAIADCKSNEVPTSWFVLPLNQALDYLSETSPTADESGKLVAKLAECDEKDRIIVMVTEGRNTYVVLKNSTR